jgi:hypothetical protein
MSHKEVLDLILSYQNNLNMKDAMEMEYTMLEAFSGTWLSTFLKFAHYVVIL